MLVINAVAWLLSVPKKPTVSVAVISIFNVLVVSVTLIAGFDALDKCNKVEGLAFPIPTFLMYQCILHYYYFVLMYVLSV